MLAHRRQQGSARIDATGIDVEPEEAGETASAVGHGHEQQSGTCPLPRAPTSDPDRADSRVDRGVWSFQGRPAIIKIMLWLARVVVDLSGWPLARPNLRDRARQLSAILKSIRRQVAPCLPRLCQVSISPSDFKIAYPTTHAVFCVYQNP